jgi:glycosyltransferase involved in cell wall biosynthesis
VLQQAAGYPLVSTIIIFLDPGPYIEEAIRSVLDQTYPAWELLLVDDGSTDGSGEVAQRYADAAPERIRYLIHPGRENRGMSASRNLGIAHARGEFIAFLDADDVWFPNKLTEQIATFSQHAEAQMLYGRTLIWHSWTGDPADAERDHTVDLGVRPDQLVSPPTLFRLLLKNQAQTPTTCSAIVRTTLVREVGGFEDEFRGMYEDQVFFSKVLLRAPVYVSGACWAAYRQHSSSCSQQVERKISYEEARRPFLEWVRRYLERQGVRHSSPAWRAVRLEMAALNHPLFARAIRRLGRTVSRLRSGSDRRRPVPNSHPADVG